MIEQIIKTSSNPNDLVLDCFCGSGTTLISANKLNRRWIGIDENLLNKCG
ncbi:MAG: site-specific DNA-methyltransferase [Methanobrevibacter sp.]|jgi:adenine-specific DNA-methyltransferase|nr:site-specific DNA-methyltransferase [Candidatus Methanovirga australis]